MPILRSIARVVFLSAVAILCAAWPASAEEFAVVEGLSTPDARGVWRPTSRTGRARVLRGDAEVPLERGMALVRGDRVVTDAARVNVRLASRELVAVLEHTDVTIEERSVIQRLGEVYYRVRGAFTVEHGSVQTVVEGTGFVVAVAEGARVTVTEHRVRVENPDATVRVRAGQQVTMPPTGPAGAVRWAPVAAGPVLARTFPRGAPLVQVGIMAAGGWANGGAAVHTRAFARLLVLPGVRVSLDTALGSNGGATGMRLPQSVGVEYALGGLSLGGQAVVAVERDRFDCGGAFVALHFGGAAYARYAIPLTRRVSVEGELRVGGVDGVVVDGAVGVGIGL